MAGSQGQITQVCFSSSVFNLEAVKRAAYSLSDELAIDINRDADRIVCTLRTLKADLDIGQLEEQFRKEVLDYDLRIRIAKETEPLRNLVLSLAFSKTGLQG
ncbi:MAG: His-Xaa-Ser system protein HxsD [Methylovirgula sp.]